MDDMEALSQEILKQFQDHQHQESMKMNGPSTDALGTLQSAGKINSQTSLEIERQNTQSSEMSRK